MSHLKKTEVSRTCTKGPTHDVLIHSEHKQLFTVRGIWPISLKTPDIGRCCIQRISIGYKRHQTSLYPCLLDTRHRCIQRISIATGLDLTRKILYWDSYSDKMDLRKLLGSSLYLWKCFKGYVRRIEWEGWNRGWRDVYHEGNVSVVWWVSESTKT